MSSSLPNTATRGRVPRMADAAVERARLTVVPSGATRTTRVPFVTLVTLLLVGGVVGLLMFNTSMQQAAFSATSLEKQATALTAQHQTLQMELEVLRDPQRVAERAQSMGMVPAVNPAFLRLEDGTVLGKPTVASAGDGVRLTPPPIRKPASLTPRPLLIRVPATAGADDTEAGSVAGSTTGSDRPGRNDDTERRTGQQDTERTDSADRRERSNR